MRIAERTSTPDGLSPPASIPAAGLGDRVARGTVAGLFAGIVFLLAQMGWAVEQLGKPAVAPLLDMSTIFNNSDTMPVATAATMLIGLVTHLTLTMLFGIAFAFIAALLRSRFFCCSEARRSASSCTW